MVQRKRREKVRIEIDEHMSKLILDTKERFNLRSYQYYCGKATRLDYIINGKDKTMDKNVLFEILNLYKSCSPIELIMYLMETENKIGYRTEWMMYMWNLVDLNLVKEHIQEVFSYIEPDIPNYTDMYDLSLEEEGKKRDYMLIKERDLEVR